MGETTLIDLSRLMVSPAKGLSANNVANSQTNGFRALYLVSRISQAGKGPEVGIKPERPLSLVDAAFSFPASLAGAMQTTRNPQLGHLNIVQLPAKRYRFGKSFCSAKAAL